MDWKALLGNAYVEGMSDEEAKQKFDELYMPKADHEKELAKNKTLIDQYTAQLAENKRKQREQMSEAEKKEAERQEQWEQLQNQNKELHRELKINKLKTAYINRGFDEDLALETATAMFEGDNETVLSNEKVFADKREASLKSAWEQEYQVNPPAGNGSGKVDLSAQITKAQEEGNMVLYASLVRQQNEANTK